MEEAKKPTTTQARVSKSAGSADTAEHHSMEATSKDPVDVRVYLKRLKDLLAKATSELTRLEADGYGSAHATHPYSSGTGVKRKGMFFRLNSLHFLIRL